MDAETFKELFLPYHDKLYRIAYHLMGNQEDAEDMVQDAYIKLWQARKGWKGTGSSEGFAIKTVKNVCLDYLRRAQLPVDDLADLSLSMDDPQTPNSQIPADTLTVGQFESRNELEYLEQIVEQLPAVQKEVIRMKYWEESSDQDIAEAVDLRPDNVRMILSRARRKIKALYRR